MGKLNERMKRKILGKNDCAADFDNIATPYSSYYLLLEFIFLIY